MAPIFDANQVDWRSLPEIHVSDCIAFLACRRAWNWSSRLRGNLEPIRPYHAFVLGRAVHEAAEKLHAHNIPPTETITAFFDEETRVLAAAGQKMGDDAARSSEVRGAVTAAKSLSDDDWLAGAGVADDSLTSASLIAGDLSMMEEQRQLAMGMLEHYARWEKRQRGPFSQSNLEFISAEQEFLVPIVHPVTGEVATWANFGGKWDGLVRRRDTGEVFIWELKTTKSITHRAKMLANDIQCSFYINAARLAFPELASHIKGMIYTLMSKSIVKPPKVLNDGTLSRDIRGQSLDSYLMWVEKHHKLRETMSDDDRRRFVSSKYGAAIAALADSTASTNTFFERHVVVRSDTALGRASDDLWHLSRAMTDVDLPLYPTPNFHCSYCLFFEPCIELQNGGKYQETLAALYRPRVHHAGESDADSD